MEKKEIEIISMKSELEELCNKLEISQNEKIIELQNIIQQKDLENDQMKTIIFELNTQNKIFREEMQNKRQLRSPAFQELKDDSSIYSHSHENMSQIDSKGMEINELYLSQRSEELINLQSPDKNLITPTEQKKTKKEIFETPLPLNNSVNSFGENHIELKDVLNNKNLNEVRLVDINEKRNEFPNKFKKTPAKKFESDKENLLSKNSTERNDFLLESISSSVYEKIVYSNFIKFVYFFIFKGSFE